MTAEPSGDSDRSLRLSVPGMDCPSCAESVSGAVGRVDGVADVRTDVTAGATFVDYDPDRTDPATIESAVEGAGYDVVGTDADEDDADAERDPLWRTPRAMKTGVSAVFLATGLVVAFAVPSLDARVATVLGTRHGVADVAFLLAVAVGGQVILRNGYYSAKTRSLDMDFLMSAAIVGAVTASLVFAESLYLEAATLAVLVNVAELLERHSMDRARRSLRELMDLSPDEATVRRNGEEVAVPVAELVVGDCVVVRPGEKIPVDGEVVDGDSAVNQAPVTGESVPVDKTTGDEVFAGTIAEEGYLEVQVTAPPGEDTLSRVIDLVEQARAKKTDREQFVERFAGSYTPIVVGLAVLTALGPPLVLGGAWETWFVRGLTFLVLACPCAFVISTPVSVVSGVTSAAKNGVLVKGGNYLEAMGEVDVVAFDKTGTLTTGNLTVTDVVPLNGNDETDVLECAYGLEHRSEHPIGEAIVDHADGTVSDPPAVSEFQAITGKGVQATLGDVDHYAGKPSLFADLGFDLSHVHATIDGGQVTTTTRQLCERNDCVDLVEEVIPRLQAEGKTVVLVGTEDELEGVLAVADQIRPEASRTIARLRDLGVERTVMLTGDNQRTARAVADEVGVDEVRAELLPEDKVAALDDLRETHDGVAMVGDGINDAPALATATVGIAMGAAGTDTALETADVALLGDDLSRLPYLRDLAGQTNGVIRQNVWSSLGAKAALAALVPFGYVPIWLAVLVGDAGMTVGVTGNAMRLSGVQPDEALAGDG
ncbi:heavy metal translocating P-type ATPase [Halobacteriales archaeon Cl-PHB]